MSDVLYEVRVAMKQERMEKFWKKYGYFIIGMIVMIIVSTGVYEGYKAWTNDRDKKESKILLSALEEKDIKALTERTASLKTDLKLLAQLEAAGRFVAANDTAGATTIYQDILKNDAVQQEFKQLAQYALLSLDQTLTVDQKLLNLSGIWEDKTNPWRYHARLDAAVMLANEKKDFKEARAQLKTLIDETIIPKGLKQKATSLDILYSLSDKEQPQTSTSETKPTSE